MDTDTKEAGSPFLQEVKNAAQGLKAAAEGMPTGKLSSEKIEDLRTQAEVLGRKLKKSGYDHHLGEVAARESGLASLVQTTPNGEIYFEVPQGSGDALQMWDRLIRIEDGSIHNYPRVAQAFFEIVATGMKPEKSQILFDAILSSPDPTVAVLKFTVNDILRGENKWITELVSKSSSDATTKERLKTITTHYPPAVAV